MKNPLFFPSHLFRIILPSPQGSDCCMATWHILHDGMLSCEMPRDIMPSDTCPRITRHQYHGPCAKCRGCQALTWHWITCHMISCPGTTCFKATCHGITCFRTTCHRITCHRITCHGMACQWITCLGITFSEQHAIG